MGVGKIRWKKFAYWMLAVLLYYCWFQAFYNSIRFGSAFPYPNITVLCIGIAYNLPPLLAVCVLNYLIVFKLVKIQNLTLKVLGDAAFSTLAFVGVNLIFQFVLTLTGIKPKIDWAGTMLNDILILLCLEMVNYHKKLIKSLKENDRDQKRILHYKYDALKSQINPHFLFNALNQLHSLVNIDPMKSQVFIRELARMYRYVMAKHGCATVEVAEEFVFLESYISVLKMRYNHKFDVIISGNPPEGKYIIPFSLQLLIENVTKHNVISTSSPVIVTIIISEDLIEITNPIHPRPSESVSKIGLRYLTELYSARNGNFRIVNDGKTFTAYVPYI